MQRRGGFLSENVALLLSQRFDQHGFRTDRDIDLDVLTYSPSGWCDHVDFKFKTAILNALNHHRGRVLRLDGFMQLMDFNPTEPVVVAVSKSSVCIEVPNLSGH